MRVHGHANALVVERCGDRDGRIGATRSWSQLDDGLVRRVGPSEEQVATGVEGELPERERDAGLAVGGHGGARECSTAEGELLDAMIAVVCYKEVSVRVERQCTWS